MKRLYDNLRTCQNLVADVLGFLTQRRKEAERNKHTDLLTPNGARDSGSAGGSSFCSTADERELVPPVSRVSGEQIRVSISRRHGQMWYTLLN